ncbi:MAG: hypothetical protein BGO67_12095 [Alphaproteobacteria bacterium 41-28]|nr:MAG: hypothetical protein BGO67_12095 [Alphaproteobacteria bacterium 41-28]
MWLNKMGENLKISPNKFHNFMVYEAIKRIISAREFDLKMLSLIEQAQLRDRGNPFFIRAKQTPALSLETAIKIASHWREILMQYTYTLLISLGKLADNVGQWDMPPEYEICALQTGITVILDDLNNAFFSLEEIAPTDPDGMNPVWWEANILRPLIAASPKKSLSTAPISPKTQRLFRLMDELAENPLGFAVQLRITESIIIDMVLFLLALFSKIEVQGQKIFNPSEMMDWIGTHIEDEVSNDWGNVYEVADTVNIVGTEVSQDLFRLAEEYINCWKAALEKLHGFLNEESVTDDCLQLACHLL